MLGGLESMVILDELKLKGYTVKLSPSNKITKNFDKNDLAQKLQDFLLLHPSCIAVFDAYVKSGEYSLNDIASKIKNLLKEMDTSFIFLAECSCGNILDAPNIATENFLIPSDKKVTCHSCGKEKTLQESDYYPDFQFKTRDCVKEIYKVLMVAKEKGLFDIAIQKECYTCGQSEGVREGDEKKVDLICSKCGKISNVVSSFIPKEPLEKLIRDRQGYWLEWFIYRLLKNEDSEVGVEIREKEGLKYEADIALYKDSKIILISCKDSDAEKNDIKLELIKDVADKFIIVTTKDNSSSPIVLASKKAFGDNFSLINSNNILNIKSYLN